MAPFMGSYVIYCVLGIIKNKIIMAEMAVMLCGLATSNVGNTYHL